MNEHLPYEDELIKRLDDLPLPNEDIAWEDMKRRLEKDDDDRPVVPLILKGCGGYALLLLLLIIVGLFIADQAKWFSDKGKKPPVKTNNIENIKEVSKDRSNTNKVLPLNIANTKTELNDDTGPAKKSITVSTLTDDTLIEKKEIVKRSSSHGSNNKTESGYIKPDPPITNYSNHQISKSSNHQNIAANNKMIRNSIPGKIEAADTIMSDPENVKKIEEQQPVNTRKEMDRLRPKVEPGLDSLKKKTADTAFTKTKARDDSLPQNKINFGAGIGVHQLLPVAGQKSNPYNSLGRKSSLSDYIPSIYLRMYKDKKWFIQSEFRYGAPQYTREVLFYEKKIVDTFGISATSSGSRLKKTFYHQLPVSFNYFVLPGFSLGAGLTFNKFSSALVQQDVHKINIIAQRDSLVSTALVSQKKADSNFAKSYIQALIEMQYRWKRLSAGARYSFGLQPYLKFKLPGGEERKESNSSLQLFIRYEFWRSGKK